MIRRLLLLLESIKFSHTVFALPFALLAMVVAADGWPPVRIFLPVLLCMTCARSAAMAYNRLTDLPFDRANPRTQKRPTATGEISQTMLKAFVLVCTALYWFSAGVLNRACFWAALPVLAILLGYSHTKRFTNLCHFWLGGCLGMAPLAAHLAVRGDFSPLPGLGIAHGLTFEIFPFGLGLLVMLWVSGFDLIYACQDYEVDRSDARLHSMPKSLGIAGALTLAKALHIGVVILLAALGYYAGMGVPYWCASVAVTALLVYEHSIVSPDDLSRVNVAFFTINGAVGILLFLSVFAEKVLLSR